MRLLCSALLAIATPLAFVGCATTFEPKVPTAPLAGFDLVDPAQVDRIKYVADHADCSALANQDMIDPQRVATGAIGAAADKVSFGVLGNKPGRNADRMTVLKRCLEGRGYKILR